MISKNIKKIIEETKLEDTNRRLISSEEVEAVAFYWETVNKKEFSKKMRRDFSTYKSIYKKIKNYREKGIELNFEEIAKEINKGKEK